MTHHHEPNDTAHGFFADDLDAQWRAWQALSTRPGDREWKRLARRLGNGAGGYDPREAFAQLVTKIRG
jgi:hypothetical protein